MADTQTLHGLDDVMRKLQALPKELSGKKGGPVARALRKGGNVIAAQAKANVRAIVAAPNAGGEASRSTGALEKAIGVTRNKRPQLDGANEGVEVKVRGGIIRKYANSRFNRGKRRDGKEYKTEPNEFYGRMLETGTEKMRPHPWLAPAFMTERQKALDTIVSSLLTDIARIVKKLSKT